MKSNITNNRIVDDYIVLIHVLIGMVLFYFFIHPMTMAIYWFEINETPMAFAQFFRIAPERMAASFSFRMTEMSIAFISLGSLIGLGSGMYSRIIMQKTKLVQKQGEELSRNIQSVIQGGENDRVEFKSSLRYDYNKDCINKSLEEVIVKTITGFLNTKGGELLIGVDDRGNILGLEHDYSSLKKRNQDGFELKIYQLITNHIGIEFCSLVQVTFYNLGGKTICRLRIEAAESAAYVRMGNQTAFYIRAGNSTQPLTIQEAVQYINSFR